jgi:hypothetical protein
MGQSVGAGLVGSLKTRVKHELRDLSRANRTLRRSRYSVPRRLLGASIVNRSVGQFLGLYVALLVLTLLSEWAINRYIPSLLPGYTGATPRDFLKDIGSYLIAAQIGILAIVSVAVGVVTLLSERNNGSSVNTDIRLYYVESYSYELATSGIALLVVLTLQLFWPLQHILHASGFGGRDYSFKLALAAVHALWFTFNLTLFLQFLTTTLRFVEPNSREILRERYSANEVIPRDATKRLLRALYHAAPTQMLGADALKDGPNISLGHGMGLGDAPIAEVTTTFSSPKQLVDVRLAPLRWVLARWQKRARMQSEGRKRFGEPRWNAQLSILANFDEVLDGRYEWVLRRDGVPLTRLETWIIRRCFRFEQLTSHELDLPTPENFLEQLIDKMVDQIEESASTGFRAALAEVVRYHGFILAAQNTKDDTGRAFNLAEVGDFFSRPDAELVRQYRRAFVAAADKIGSDTSFMGRLSYAAAGLVPDDALNFSPRVLQALLQLGVHEVIALEDWVTKRAVIGPVGGDAGTSTALTGSDKRAYENVLIEFVGGWERLLHGLISSFGIERRPRGAEAAQQWAAFAGGVAVLQAHLHNAAYFLAAAVWNDDALGADRFRDLLLRWPQPFYANLQATYVFSNTLLLTPDFIDQDWQHARTEIARRLRFGQETVEPGSVSGILLWQLHSDVVCIGGLVALHWYATDLQPSDTAAQAAILALRREVRTSDGSDLTGMTPKTTFRLLLDCTIRYALNPRFAEARNSATIDGLVRYLTDLASPRMVSGRVYGGFGIDGFDTLLPVLLAAMTANLPDQGDDGVAALVEDMKCDPLFEDDKTVKRFIWTVQQMIDSLAASQASALFEKAARTFNRELDLTAAAARLRDILEAAVATFSALREERLRAAPLDESRMDLVRRSITKDVLANGPAITCFQGYSIHPDDSGEIASTETEFGVIDKGSFVRPEMADVTFSDLPPLFVNVSHDCLADMVWHSLHQRPKRVVSIDVSGGTEPFWRAVIDESPAVGPLPIVIVPYPGFGSEITLATMRVPGAGLAGFDISRVPNMPSGGGTGYIGTINGVHVYSARIFTNRAVLCSSHLIRTIRYGVVHGQSDLVDITFVEGEDLAKSRVRLTFAQHIEWAANRVVEFQITGQEAASV